MKNSEERLSFGGFTLDLRLRALFRGDQRVHLTPKPLEALIFLVAHRGHVVAKDALLAAVWKDVAVTDGVLVQAVREIRRALDDDKENSRFVQTVPREGYRFVGEVTAAPATTDDQAGEPAPPPTSSSLRPLIVVVGIAAVALGVIGWRAWTNGREPQSATASETGGSEVQIAPLTGAGISAVKPAFSPDGRALLYVSDAPEATGVQDLFLLPLNGGKPWRLTSLVNAAGDLPVFTANGRDVVFSRYRVGDGGSRVPDLWQVSSLGGPVSRYIPEASGAGFSPDGNWVAYTRHTSGARSLVISPTARIGDTREISSPGFTPRWSPDGRWLAYTTSYPEGGEGDLWVVSSALTERRRLTHESHQLYGLTWSADSGSVIFASKVGNAFHLWRAALSGGAIQPLTIGVGDYASPSVSADGSALAFTQLRPIRDLVAAPVDGGDPVNITTNEFHSWPRLSPSARSIASVVQRSTADAHLYITDLETKESRRVSDVPAQYPCWIDDEHVAYLTPTAHGFEIRRVRVASGENVTLAQLTTAASWLAVRPGGVEAAFVVSAANRSQIVLRDLLSGHQTVLAEGSDVEALRWRPDGTLLSWSGPRVAADARSNGVFVAAGRADSRRVAGDGYGPVWSADGGLFFLKHLGDRDEAGIWRRDLASGAETQLRAAPRIDYFDVGAGTLVFARSTARSQVFSIPLK